MTKENEPTKSISTHALKRLPIYCSYLKAKQEKGVKNISAPMIANDLRFNEVKVRKDLAAISSSGGKPKTGYVLNTLIADLEQYLGYNNVNRAVLVGAGQLGKSLLSYRGFDDYGLEIVAAFDRDETIIGSVFNGKSVFHLDKLKDLSERLRVHIGIITVPTEQAQSVCDKLIEGGVLAIWNFAPVHLNVPEHILVQNENMASSLAVLSRHLAEKIDSTTTHQTT